MNLKNNALTEQNNRFGVAMVTAKKPLPVHILSRLMGHATSKITEIYLQVTGEEHRQLVESAWEDND